LLPCSAYGKQLPRANRFECAITLTRPAKPSINGKLKIPDPNNRRRKITVSSYGAFLLNRRFSRVGMKLRRLVAQCLSDEPTYRPDPGELKPAMTNHLQRQNWTGRIAIWRFCSVWGRKC
jgi:hypothetical protein